MCLQVKCDPLFIVRKDGWGWSNRQGTRGVPPSNSGAMVRSAEPGGSAEPLISTALAWTPGISLGEAVLAWGRFGRTGEFGRTREVRPNRPLHRLRSSHVLDHLLGRLAGRFASWAGLEGLRWTRGLRRVGYGPPVFWIWV